MTHREEILRNIKYAFAVLCKRNSSDADQFEGELVPVHAAFRQPVKIAFSRPSYRRQEAAIEEPGKPQNICPDAAFSVS